MVHSMALADKIMQRAQAHRARPALLFVLQFAVERVVVQVAVVR